MFCELVVMSCVWQAARPFFGVRNAGARTFNHRAIRQRNRSADRAQFVAAMTRSVATWKLRTALSWRFDKAAQRHGSSDSEPAPNYFAGLVHATVAQSLEGKWE